MNFFLAICKEAYKNILEVLGQKFVPKFAFSISIAFPKTKNNNQS
jgi:hypothetical protein